MRLSEGEPIESVWPSTVTFADEVSVLQPLGRHRAAEDVVLELVGLRGHGKTDLAAALRGARRELTPATADERVVVLLGDPGYYARFGFVPASHFGIAADPAWGAYFQACALGDEADVPSGTYTYAEPFARLG